MDFGLLIILLHSVHVWMKTKNCLFYFPFHASNLFSPNEIPLSEQESDQGINSTLCKEHFWGMIKKSKNYLCIGPRVKLHYIY